MLASERTHVDVPGLAWAACGRVAGTFGGVWILLAVSPTSLSVLLGVCLLFAVAASILNPTFEPGVKSLLLAGVTSGVIGTATGIGGPAMGLVYQTRPAPQLRATLAALFFGGITVSIIALGAVGQIQRWHVELAMWLVVPLLVGLAGSRTVRPFLSDRVLRVSVLTFATVAGLMVVARGLV